MKCKLLIYVLLLCLTSIYSCKLDKMDEKPITSSPAMISTQSGSVSNIGREAWQKPEYVISKLGDLEDKTVADIGAGSGYFAFRLAFKAKKVICIEIDTNMINLMDAFKANLPPDIRNRVETRLAKEDDPELAKNEVDHVIIINTIAYINNRIEYLNKLRKGLSESGRIMILDYKMKNLPIEAPPFSERVYMDKIEDALVEAGFKNVTTDDTSLEYQYMIFGEK